MFVKSHNEALMTEACLYKQHKLRKGLISKPIRLDEVRSVTATLRHYRRSHSHWRSRRPTLVRGHHWWSLSIRWHSARKITWHALMMTTILTMRWHWRSHCLLLWQAWLWWHHTPNWSNWWITNWSLSWSRKISLIFR